MTSALTWNLGRGCFERPKILAREFYILRAQIFLKPVQFRRPGDRHNPWLLCQQAGERDLRRRPLKIARSLSQC